MVQALVDNGCLCSGIIDDALAKSLQLPRIAVTPRPIETAENSTIDKPTVEYITRISLDLDGYVTTNLRLYILPHSTHPMILGKKWLEDQDVLIHAKEQRLDLRKSGGRVFSVKRWRQELRNVARPRVSSAKDIGSLVKKVPICKATLEDINKALQTKPLATLEDARKRLPEQVRNYVLENILCTILYG